MECRVRRAGGAVCITLPGMRPINPPHLTPDKQSVTPRARSRKLSAGRFSAAAVTLPIVGTSACKRPHAAGPRAARPGASSRPRPPCRRRGLPQAAPRPARPCRGPRSLPHRLRRWRLRLPPSLTAERPAACSPRDGPDQAARRPARREGSAGHRVPPAPGGGAQPT